MTKKAAAAKRPRLDAETKAGLAFTSPFIIGFLLFMIVPMMISLYYSLCDYNILSAPVFVGLKNYIKMFSDEVFFKTIGVTFFYALISVPLRLAFALLVAMLLLNSSRLTAFYRAAYYLPSIIGGSVAVSILWKRMFAIDGVINKVLAVFGMKDPVSWLGDKNTAIWTLILLAVWQFGSSMLIFLAAIKNIPASYHEAAIVDGAGPIRRFFSITFPMLTPVLFFNLINQTIGSFQAFNSSYLITGGNPLDSTLYYALHLYNESFLYWRMGYGCAMAWFLLVIIGILTMFVFKSSSAWVYYESEGR